MIPLRIFLAGLLATLVSVSLARSQGARLVVHLASQEDITCELLSVRENSLVVSTVEMKNDNIAPSDLSTILVLNNRDIERVLVEGKSRFVEGLWKGTLYGAATGVAIGLLSGDDPHDRFISFTAGQKAVILGITIGATGLVVGSVIGAMNSTSDRELTPLPGGDLSILRPVSRYPSGEPQWLSIIQ